LISVVVVVVAAVVLTLGFANGAGAKTFCSDYQKRFHFRFLVSLLDYYVFFLFIYEIR